MKVEGEDGKPDKETKAISSYSIRETPTFSVLGNGECFPQGVSPKGIGLLPSEGERNNGGSETGKDDEKVHGPHHQVT